MHLPVAIALNAGAARLCPKCYAHVRRGDLTEKNFLGYCDRFRDSVKRSIELFASIKEKDEHAFKDLTFIDSPLRGEDTIQVDM